MRIRAALLFIVLLLPGCCNPADPIYQYGYEVRELSGLPPGWTAHEAGWFISPKGTHRGTPDDPTIPQEDCAVLCGADGTTVKAASCKLAVDCTDPPDAGAALDCDWKPGEPPPKLVVVCNVGYPAVCGL